MTVSNRSTTAGGNRAGENSNGVLWMIDNNPSDLEIIGIVCEMVGFTGNFVPLASGRHGLDHLATIWDHPDERPDMILLDINMPRFNGLEVLREIRNDPRWQQLPVVMFSTSTKEEQVARVSGATDYIVKSTLLAETVAAIRRLIGRYCKPGSLAANGRT